MLRISLILSCFITLLFNLSCGSNIGTKLGSVTFNDENLPKSNECFIILSENTDLDIWSDIDIEFENGSYIEFSIDVYCDDVFLGRLKVNPFKNKVVIKELKTIKPGLTTWQFTAKNATFRVEKSGTYRFECNISNISKGVIIKNATIEFYR